MADLRHLTPVRVFLGAIEMQGGVACQDIPEIFFPEDYADKQTRDYAIQTAKKLCHACPLKTECFAYAVEADERYGIWAGTLPSER